MKTPSNQPNWKNWRPTELPIGKGRTAEVYGISETLVMKLFYPGFTAAAKREAAVAQALQGLGLPLPRMYGAFNVDGCPSAEPTGRPSAEPTGRPGILYRRVRGRSLLACMLESPASMPGYARMMAALQAVIHQKSSPRLPSLRRNMEEAIQAVPWPGPVAKRRIVRYLRTLPEGEAVCHFDFHPDNILLEEGRPVVIDWVNAAAGHPYADICRTWLILSSGALPPDATPVQTLAIGAAGRALAAMYLRAVCRLTGAKKEDVRCWLLPVAAARLNEGIGRETARLKRLVLHEMAENK